MKNIDKDRFKQLSRIANILANDPGLTNLSNSTAGAELAITTLIGHLMLHDENLNNDELLGLLIAKELLKEVGNVTND